MVDPHYREDLRVSVIPPAGWDQRPVKVTNTSTMQLWVSPSATTALGVIRFKLPLPVGHDLALWGFLQHMKKSEGKAELIEKQWDDNARILRFVAEGGRYRVRTNLTVDGTDGWAIFAGTRTESPVNEPELGQAILARDAVRVVE